MAPGGKSGAGSGSDMELSSGSDSPSSATANVNVANVNDDTQGDAMQRGVDFIGFDSSDDESSESDYDYTPRSKNMENKNKKSSAGSDPKSGSLKRTRSDDSDDDSDGPSTGPPPGCPWMGHRKYSKMESVPMMLTQELKDFVDFISPTREEHQVRKYVARRLEEVIKNLWRDVKVVVFGSFETKLYLPTSDMDIVVLRNQSFSKTDLWKLASFLRTHSAARDVNVIAKAKVPIIKCKEAISGIAVDISFNMANGIQSAEVVTRYLEEMPGLRALTMLVKYFLMLKSHNEVFNGGLGSYTTVIMILSFLQMHPEVQRKRLNPEDNLGVLLIEFFELYGTCFHYQKVGLSVTDGGSYIDKYARGLVQMNNGRYELLLTCIDPNDPANDTARGSYSLKKIREVFVGAYGALTKAILERHRELFPDSNIASSKRGHFHVDEHNRVPADSTQKSSGLHKDAQVSLIKGVLSIPRDVSQHRQEVENVFYEGIFQRMYGDPEGINGLDQIEGKQPQDTEPRHLKSNTHEKVNERITIKGIAERKDVPQMPMKELEYSVFKEMKYQTHPGRDAPKVQKLFYEPLENLRDMSPTNENGIRAFALSTQELTHRVALNMIHKLENKERRYLSEKEWEDTFREAQKMVKNRYESVDKKKTKKILSTVLSRDEIIETVRRVPIRVGALQSKHSGGTTNTTPPSASSSSHSAPPLRDVEFIPEDDSDSDGGGDETVVGSRKYYEALLRRGNRRYGDREEGESRNTSGSGGHKNPRNVNASENSIQLPQLVSIRPSQPYNNSSSRNEQLSQRNTQRG
ncbi:hypothetical protein BGX21_005871 [Mortierella sp. AD011]|nr:hypothetical protein BGX20_002489 [Mortierella sp. AD010]KAF9399645.1 hypothetical protein BGX21_005871 [Mortierella sp. AD011]